MRDTFSSKVHQLSEQVQSERAGVGQQPAPAPAPAPAAGGTAAAPAPTVNGQPMSYRNEDRARDCGKYIDSEDDCPDLTYAATEVALL